MFEEYTYNVKIPSTNIIVEVQPLLVSQYNKLVEESYKTPFLNIGFNFQLNNILKTNINTLLTEFDKAVICLFIRKNDLQLNTNIKNYSHPEPLHVEDIIVNIPTLEEENAYLNFINKLVKLDTYNRDKLLIAEISKYVYSDLNYDDRLDRVSKLSITTLAKIVNHIDYFKDLIKNTISRPLDISLFLE